MSDNLKPCRWAQDNYKAPDWPDCQHKLLVHLRQSVQAQCHGCPCHEPRPAAAKTRAAIRTESGDEITVADWNATQRQFLATPTGGKAGHDQP